MNFFTLSDAKRTYTEHKKATHSQYFIQVVSLNIRYDILDIKPETMVGLMQSVIIQVYAAYLLIML